MAGGAKKSWREIGKRERYKNLYKQIETYYKWPPKRVKECVLIYAVKISVEVQSNYYSKMLIDL